MPSIHEPTPPPKPSPFPGWWAGRCIRQRPRCCKVEPTNQDEVRRPPGLPSLAIHPHPLSHSFRLKQVILWLMGGILGSRWSTPTRCSSCWTEAPKSPQESGFLACSSRSGLRFCSDRFCHARKLFVCLSLWDFAVVCRVPAWPVRVDISVRSDLP